MAGRMGGPGGEGYMDIVGSKGPSDSSRRPCAMCRKSKVKCDRWVRTMIDLWLTPSISPGLTGAAATDV